MQMSTTEKDTTYSDRQRAVDESYKLVYDFFKHVTTLSTGSILLLVAFLERIFHNPVAKGLVAVALASFIVATLCSLLDMYIIAIRIGPDYQSDTRDHHGRKLSYRRRKLSLRHRLPCRFRSQESLTLRPNRSLDASCGSL
jgi:hypothetical protein